jgi:hypothetical protein
MFKDIVYVIYYLYFIQDIYVYILKCRLKTPEMSRICWKKSLLDLLDPPWGDRKDRTPTDQQGVHPGVSKWVLWHDMT